MKPTKSMADDYNNTLEGAGMMSPRRAAQLLSILPPETLRKIGVPQANHLRSSQQTQNESAKRTHTERANGGIAFGSQTARMEKRFSQCDNLTGLKR